MAYLVFEHGHQRHAGLIGGRLLIGRKPGNSIVVNDADVSRLHAWITQDDGQWIISDANSRTGTFINGDPIPFRHVLADGDEIRIGPARLTFQSNDGLPGGIDIVDFPVRESGVEFSYGGIQFDCRCGAPLWVDARHARQTGACKYCGAMLVIPAAPPQPVSVPPAPATREPSQTKQDQAKPSKSVKCSICHWPIETGQEQMQCPDCHLPFHTECWNENLGCSSYGCAQVNALAQKNEQEQPAQPINDEEPPPEPHVHHFPWDYVLLAASVIALPVGSMAFGSLSLLTGFCSMIYLFMRRPRKKIAAMSLLLSLVGIAVGLAVSDYWWLKARYLHRSGILQ